MKQLLIRLDDALGALENLFLIVVHGAIAVLVMAGVVLRYVFNDPLTWGEELIIGLFTWMIFVAAASALRENLHIRIDALGALWRKPALRWMNVLTVIVGLVILSVMTWACVEQLLQEAVVDLPMLGVSKAWFLAAMPVGMVLAAIHATRLWVERGAVAVFRGEVESMTDGGRA
jgi:TRAP-type C4-dicarboxylate transport system permease small subunit